MPKTSSWTPFHTQLHQTLLHRKILPQNQQILIALSGGQDSLCLTKLLIDLQPKWHWNLGIIHCDHRWRPDSAANAEHVAQLATAWQLTFYLKTAEQIPQTEATARQWRYQTFLEIALTDHYSHIVTAHTASDRAETLIYNLIRGSGADGLSALTWQRPLLNLEENPDFNTQNSPEQLTPQIYLTRPLLNFTRSQTAQFCQSQNLPIWEDSTNQDLHYARNRIRAELLPYLQTHFNPQAEQTLAQTAELLRADVEYLEDLATTLRHQLIPPVHPPSAITPNLLPQSLNRHLLRQAPLALQRRVLRQVLTQILPTSPRFEDIEKLTTLLVAPNRSQTDPFPGGIIAYIDHPWLIFAEPSKATEEP